MSFLLNIRLFLTSINVFNSSETRENQQIVNNRHFTGFWNLPKRSKHHMIMTACQLYIILIIHGLLILFSICIITLEARIEYVCSFCLIPRLKITAPKRIMTTPTMHIQASILLPLFFSVFFILCPSPSHTPLYQNLHPLYLHSCKTFHSDPYFSLLVQENSDTIFGILWYNYNIFVTKKNLNFS